MTRMIVLAALLAALGSSTTFAQTQSSDAPVHFSFAYGPSVHTAGATSQGDIVRNGAVTSIVPALSVKPMFVVQGDYTPADGLGFGARMSGWSSSGSVSGSEPAKNTVKMWGVDQNAHIESTDLIVRGDIGYEAASRSKVRRFDGLAFYGRSFNSGYVSFFGGLAHAAIESEMREGQKRTYLLLNQPPGKPLDPVAIQEVYAYNSISTVSYKGFGPTVGLEATVCPVRRILLQGRGSLAWFMWGSGSTATGAWSWTKTGSLVPTTGGVNQASGANLFAPITATIPVGELKKGRITGTELDASIRYRISDNLQIGGGPMWSRYSGLPGQTWMVPAGRDSQFGQWQMSTRSLSAWSLAASISARF